MSLLGNMRHVLSLQQETRTPDTAGGAALGWTTVATLWASVEPLRGTEDTLAEKLTGVITHKILVRDEATITAAMRFLWGSRIFNIRSIKNIEECGRFLEILAEEGVAT